MCCDRYEADDKEITGVCINCECDINKDGETVEDGCGYSPIVCDDCGWQPCNLWC